MTRRPSARTSRLKPRAPGPPPASPNGSYTRRSDRIDTVSGRRNASSRTTPSPPANAPTPPDPRRSSNRRRHTGYRRSRISGSVIRVLVLSGHTQATAGGTPYVSTSERSTAPATPDAAPSSPVACPPRAVRTCVCGRRSGRATLGPRLRRRRSSRSSQTTHRQTSDCSCSPEMRRTRQRLRDRARHRHDAWMRSVRIARTVPDQRRMHPCAAATFENNVRHALRCQHIAADNSSGLRGPQQRSVTDRAPPPPRTQTHAPRHATAPSQRTWAAPRATMQ